MRPTNRSRTGARRRAPRPRHDRPARRASTTTSDCPRTPTPTRTASPSDPAVRRGGSATSPGPRRRASRRSAARRRPVCRRAVTPPATTHRSHARNLVIAPPLLVVLIGHHGSRAYPRGMPDRSPANAQLRARVRISDVTPQVECGRYAVKRVVGDAVEVRATVVADGHAQVRCRSCGTARVGSPRWNRVPMLESHDEPDRFAGCVPGRSDRAVGVHRRRVGRRRRDVARRAARARSRRARPSWRRARRRRATARRRPRRRRDRSARAGEVRVAKTSLERPLAVSTEPCSRRSVPGTSCSPARSAGSTASSGAARDRRPRLRRGVPAADPPDRHHEPQGPQQRAARRARRSREPVGDRRRRGRPQGGAPRPRHPRRLRPPRRARPRAGARDRARLRGPVLARPSVAREAPGVVRVATRRLGEVRREPAEALPGHRQRRLRQPEGEAAVGSAARRGRALDRARRAHLPGRQPAHQAASRSGSG